MNLIINFFLTSVKEISKYIGHTLGLAEINFLVETGFGQSTYTASQQLLLPSIFGVKTLKLQHATHVETLPTHTHRNTTAIQPTQIVINFLCSLEIGIQE